MAVINLPATKSLTLTNRIPLGNINNKKLIVGNRKKDIYYSYLFFDIAKIPDNIVLLSAVLVLFKVSDFFPWRNKKFFVYPLLQEFSSFTTYENPCLIDLNPSLKKEFFPYTKNVAIEVDITKLFSKWMNCLLINQGIVIKDDSKTKLLRGCTSFGSANSKDKTLIPFIRVSFKEKNCCCILPTEKLSYTASVTPKPH